MLRNAGKLIHLSPSPEAIRQRTLKGIFQEIEPPYFGREGCWQRCFQRSDN